MRKLIVNEFLMIHAVMQARAGRVSRSTSWSLPLSRGDTFPRPLAIT